jgi:hypothetical protein
VCLQVLVHLVDVNTHQLVHALLVCTEARLPSLHRQLEVSAADGNGLSGAELHAGQILGGFWLASRGAIGQR